MTAEWPGKQGLKIHHETCSGCISLLLSHVIKMRQCSLLWPKHYWQMSKSRGAQPNVTQILTHVRCKQGLIKLYIGKLIHNLCLSPAQCPLQNRPCHFQMVKIWKIKKDEWKVRNMVNILTSASSCNVNPTKMELMSEFTKKTLLSWLKFCSIHTQY